jgi:hypothetical protein
MFFIQLPSTRRDRAALVQMLASIQPVEPSMPAAFWMLAMQQLVECVQKRQIVYLRGCPWNTVGSFL